LDADTARARFGAKALERDPLVCCVLVNQDETILTFE
jgi:hypothetical protein